MPGKICNVCGIKPAARNELRCNACRSKSWRQRNGLRSMSVSIQAKLMEQVAVNAKKRNISKNEMVLTYIQWGIDNDG